MTRYEILVIAAVAGVVTIAFAGAPIWLLALVALVPAAAITQFQITQETAVLADCYALLALLYLCFALAVLRPQRARAALVLGMMAVLFAGFVGELHRQDDHFNRLLSHNKECASLIRPGMTAMAVLSIAGEPDIALEAGHGNPDEWQWNAWQHRGRYWDNFGFIPLKPTVTLTVTIDESGHV